ncbi:MAG: hypothetical protein COT25_04590 [Candidatus Kerfeldbacteria bacterium CG08_land_8_20_14_0_20_42_7]|uniref:Uncharacterized protein n=1 Tax=Candidatus Kerfeldbacteria bacterium CG08_land_8_20_14_0_20_42_7 TaxID=2014245 RepID=A0A2H0YRU8_9BACT|nr:MAG: hypothetical protein COT25_04590 [Candidatus Kerfeldbacteria bacterium CG08_land_8_20_14_0_20_42_7]
MRNSKDLHFSNKILTTFLASHYSKLITGIFLILICFGFYLLYQLLYPTIINPEPIKSSEFNIQKEKIDLERYTQTGRELEKKGKANDDLIPPTFLDKK